MPVILPVDVKLLADRVAPTLISLSEAVKFAVLIEPPTLTSPVNVPVDPPDILPLNVNSLSLPFKAPVSVVVPLTVRLSVSVRSESLVVIDDATIIS